MKIIKLIDGKEYVIDDDEAEYVKGLLLSGKAKFLSLSNGEIINATSISRIGELDKKPFYNYYPVEEDRSGRFIRRDGKEYLLADDHADLIYKDDPKYLTMPKVSVYKMLKPELK